MIPKLGKAVLHAIFWNVDFVKASGKMMGNAPRVPKTYRQAKIPYITTENYITVEATFGTNRDSRVESDCGSSARSGF